MASRRALPVSHCTMSRPSSRRASTRSWKRSMIRVRSASGRAAHDLWPARSESTAASTSDSAARGSSYRGRPSKGATTVTDAAPGLTLAVARSRSTRPSGSGEVRASAVGAVTR